MDELLPWEEPYECPHCGHVGPYNDFEPGTDISEAIGAVECPSCNCCIWNDTCPACGASVGYDDTEVVDDPAMCGCPVCGEASPTDDWFG